MSYVAIGIRCLIGVVFLVSSLSKVSRRGAFASFTASVSEMRLLPPALAGTVASAVVSAECAVCVLLVIPAAPAMTLGFLAAAGMLTTFAAAITLSLRRGGRVACRCFGASTTPLGLLHVVRNGVLASLAILAAVVDAPRGPVQGAGALAAVCAGVMAAGVVVKLDDLVGLFTPVRSQSFGSAGRVTTRSVP
ncbi:MauE/DoxX family redox-associated membrane protein [Streptomyces sp. NPDC096176]|uniref:MauE/DoxX family redox-associated membrane protein n=1 Tax=Streptomyces sp. NPDC096176 TaxID=3366079 RepID=UPI0037FF07E0